MTLPEGTHLGRVDRRGCSATCPEALQTRGSSLGTFGWPRRPGQRPPAWLPLTPLLVSPHLAGLLWAPGWGWGLPPGDILAWSKRTGHILGDCRQDGLGTPGFLRWHHPDLGPSYNTESKK